MYATKKRPFYIIGHNPNTIEEAREFLRLGANALEPDIVHADNQFYVCHHPQSSYQNVPTVQDYLQALKGVLLREKFDLALIIWDTKTTDFDPTHFMRVVKECFSGTPFDGVTMLITNADDHGFLSRYSGRHSNVGTGLDESDIPPADVEAIFKSNNQQNLSYADGITTLLSKTGVFENITAALKCRNENGPGSFALVYTWVVSREVTMRKYLDVYIDGMMIDAEAAAALKKLIESPPYNDVYELARSGYNPFAALPVPQYKLIIATADKPMAGTDARVIFTLTGTDGSSLQSLPFDSSDAGMLERGSSCCVMMEGKNIGKIKSLSIELISGGFTSSWLPATITVQSKWLEDNVSFIFNSGGQEEWITFKGGKITRYPS